jgi:hypothetical protein
MALTWIEDASSRSATIFRLGRKDASTRSRVFNVIGTSNEDALHAACNAAISTTYPFWTYPGQPTVKLRAESYSVEYQGDTAWRVTINYEKIGADDVTQSAPLKRTRAFDTSGGTRHITNALQKKTVSGTTTTVEAGERVYGPSGLADGASMKGAIAVDDRGVNGVDVVVPALSWTESYEVPSSYVTSAYIRNLARLTGSVNDASFRGFAAGEVLFVGGQGSHEWDDQRGHGPWSLSYKFVASPNCGNGKTMPSQKIGDIDGVEVGGHEYVWVRYASSDDTSKNQIVRLPVAVYVNRVYPDGDFSQLGIGVT